MPDGKLEPFDQFADDHDLVVCIGDAIGALAADRRTPIQRAFWLAYQAGGLGACDGLGALQDLGLSAIAEAWDLLGARDYAHAAWRLDEIVAANAQEARAWEVGQMLDRFDYMTNPPVLGGFARANSGEFEGLGLGLPTVIPELPADADVAELESWVEQMSGSVVIEGGSVVLIDLGIRADREIERRLMQLAACRAARSVTELHLSTHHYLTADGLAALAPMALESLDLSFSTGEPGMVHGLVAHDALRELCLRGPSFDDDALAVLLACPRLEALDVCRSPCSLDAIEQLAPRLRSLKVTQPVGTSGSRNWSRLESLLLDSDGECLPVAAEFFTELRGLRSLFVDSRALDEAAVVSIASLPVLRELTLWSAVTNGSCLRHLERHPTLNRLNLDGVQVDREVAEALATIPGLSDIYFEQRFDSDALDWLRSIRPDVAIH